MQIANQYLEQCQDIIINELIPEQKETLNQVHISYGFTSKASGKMSRRAIGQCWATEAIKAIFVHPCLFTEDNHIQILGVLIHELIHAYNVGAGHKGAFRTEALRLGLEGKMTATTVSNELRERLNALKFPKQPICPLEPTSKKKAGSRLVKLECACGRILRMSTKVACEGDIECRMCDELFQIVEA